MKDKLDWKTALIGVLALLVVGALIIPGLFGGGDKESDNNAAPSTTSAASPDSKSIEPQSNTSTRTSSTAAPTSSSSSTKELTGQAADEAALRAVLPKWGTFKMSDPPDASQWVNQFSDLDEVSNRFTTLSKSRFETLWGGALQQGVNVTACKIVSIKKGATKGDVTTYDVTTEHTMEAVDSSTKGLDGTYEQKWSFDVKHEDGGPVVDAFEDKTES